MFQVSEGWISIKGFHVMARYLFSIVLLSLCGILIYRSRNNTQLYLEEKFDMPFPDPDVLYGCINRRDTAEINAVPHGNSTTSGHRSFHTDDIIRKLERHVKDSKPFLQSGYTIHDLSKEIEIPVYQLSYAINHAYDLHFSNWLNHQRIEHFLQTAADKHHMTLEAMAKEAGFSNRVTFINAFKKEKGMTPGLYMKRQAEKSV